MPLPFILGGIAAAAAGYGAKKGYDGTRDTLEANKIIKQAKLDYEAKKLKFDLSSKNLEKNLDKLGNLQLKIGSDFGEFRKIAESLLEKINSSDKKNLEINIPKHKLNKIKQVEFSTTAFLGKVVGAGIGGAAAAYAVYGGVMAFAAASTGTPIAALSGIAAYNATLAAIGGGSLAAGGFGMAGGAMVLGSVVAAPVIAIAGWAFSSYGEDALKDAKKARVEVDDAIKKLISAKSQLDKISNYSLKIYHTTESIYEVFTKYFNDLKTMDAFVRNGGNIEKIEDALINIIQNGYTVAAILTDIITTPLFKPKLNDYGDVIMDANKVVQLETDENGIQVLNEDKINEVLAEAEKDVSQVAA